MIYSLFVRYKLVFKFVQDQFQDQFVQAHSIYRITNERSQRSSYKQSYIGSFDDIQIALKPLKKAEKMYINFQDHFKTTLII